MVGITASPALIFQKRGFKMTKQHKLLLIVASLLLAGAFVFPLWKIRLRAPQYPEGLGLNIWINTVKGAQPNNISTINDLNHYIGMKKITPDAIPELKVMPYIILFFLVTGIAIALTGRRSLLLSWIIGIVIFATAGLADFYKWEYDYGHHLNPDAAIKVPGMTYQPPLIGGKQLLNIHVTSIPGIGGIILILSLLIGLYVLVNEIRSNKLPKAM